MNTNSAPTIFKLLANDVRWKILTLLAQSDMRVQEIAEQLHQPQNLVSYHLQKLHKHGLVQEHQSSADGREFYYGISLSRIREVVQFAQLDLHPALAFHPMDPRSVPHVRVLFLCTHNSARSQMAEGLLRTKSNHQMHVFSAGTDPLPVNAVAIAVMRERNIDIAHQQSKSPDGFLKDSFHYVISVCDRARKHCPTFPGHPIQIHWSVADPTRSQNSTEKTAAAFQAVAAELDERIESFLTQVSYQIKAK